MVVRQPEPPSQLNILKTMLKVSLEKLDHFMIPPLDLNRFPRPEELYQQENPENRAILLLDEWRIGINRKICSSGCCASFILPGWADKGLVGAATNDLRESLEGSGWKLRVVIDWDLPIIKLEILPGEACIDFV
jgi:hypothetical protein